jgi:tetratricopeptide (TPR) repeat protein
VNVLLAPDAAVGDPSIVVRVCRIALAIALVAAPVRGDVPAKDAKRALQLFDDGRKRIAAKQVDAACDAFAESLALDPQIGTRLNLASCREQQGRFGDAYTLYDEAASEAARTGKQGRAEFARQQLHALEARVVRVRIQITNPTGTKVMLAGAPIDPAKLQLVAPGTIVVEVTAADKKPFRVEKSGAAGSELTIDVPPLDPITGPEVTTPVRVAPPPVAQRSRTYLVVGGAGVVVGAVAVGVLVHGKSRYDTAFKAGDRAGVASAQREADIATGLAIASAAAIGVGIVLYVRGRPSASDGLAIAPIATQDSLGLAVGGAW